MIDSSAGLRDEVLGSCLVRQEYIQAAGQKSNNKLVIERLAANPETLKKVVKALGQIATDYEVNYIMGVPTGGVWLADKVASEARLPHIKLTREIFSKSVMFLTDVDQYYQWNLCRGMLVEDFVTTGGSIAKVLYDKDSPVVQHDVAVIASLQTRGHPELVRSFHCPHETLIQEYIPSILPDDSPIWDLAHKESGNL